MLIANCPHCSEPIRIPGAAAASSRVRCPWCEETYLLADVFEHLPPLVEVLEGPGSQSTIVLVPDGESEYELAGAAVPDFNFKESEGTGSSSPAPLARIEGRSTAATRRPPKSTTNPLWEAFKVVGGGVFGIFIALYAVMWLKNTDYLHIVQFMPASAYFAVPEELWTEEMRTAATSKTDATTADPPAQESPAEPEVETLRVKQAPPPAEPANDDQVKAAVEEGMSSLGAAFNEAKNRGDAPPPKLGQTDFVPPPAEPIVVKPSPKVEAQLATELTQLTAEIGPIGAEFPKPKTPEPVKRREPVSLAPAGEK